ncbi:MAG: hypothetical protein C0597_08585 [Marinilabiliales bacterium]|nr:MAG: hypothetical protein C0597_08585 [Marinilabiliales bacterium]
MKLGLFIYKFIITVLIVYTSQKLIANNESKLVDVNVQFDFRTMHIWRGTVTSYTPTFEPTFEISKENTTSGIWFAQSIDGNYTELDLYFTYNFQNFSFTIFDYYCPASIETSHEITNYNRNSTKHTIELYLAFNGTNQFPLKILVATMIYGDDINSETNQNYYSTYLEFGYSAQIEKSSLDFFLGLNPFKGYYGDKFGIVNAGLSASRNIRIYKSWEIPIQAALITNPSANSLFLNFGFTL